MDKKVHYIVRFKYCDCDGVVRSCRLDCEMYSDYRVACDNARPLLMSDSVFSVSIDKVVSNG